MLGRAKAEAATGGVQKIHWDCKGGIMQFVPKFCHTTQTGQIRFGGLRDPQHRVLRTRKPWFPTWNFKFSFFGDFQGFLIFPGSRFYIGALVRSAIKWALSTEECRGQTAGQGQGQGQGEGAATSASKTASGAAASACQTASGSGAAASARGRRGRRPPARGRARPPSTALAERHQLGM